MSSTDNDKDTEAELIFVPKCRYPMIQSLKNVWEASCRPRPSEKCLLEFAVDYGYQATQKVELRG